MKEIVKYEDLTAGDIVKFYSPCGGILYGIVIENEDCLSIWREKAMYSIITHPYKDRLMWPIKLIQTSDDIPDYNIREFQNEVIDAAKRNGIEYNLRKET